MKEALRGRTVEGNTRNALRSSMSPFKYLLEVCIYASNISVGISQHNSVPTWVISYK